MARTEIEIAQNVNLDAIAMGEESEIAIPSVMDIESINGMRHVFFTNTGRRDFYTAHRNYDIARLGFIPGGFTFASIDGDEFEIKCTIDEIVTGSRDEIDY